MGIKLGKNRNETGLNLLAAHDVKFDEICKNSDIYFFKASSRMYYLKFLCIRITKHNTVDSR